MVAVSATSKCRGKSPGVFFYPNKEPMTKELSIFVDESGDRSGRARYYLITLVFHDQSDGIMGEINRYKMRLAENGLPDVAFRSEPLLNGHKEYGGLTVEQRKKMLVMFSTLVRRLPIRYASFAYRRSEFEDLPKLTTRMKRDISNLLFDHLQLFQSFDDVKVYYDDGQDIVKQALDQSIGFVLSKGIVKRRAYGDTPFGLLVRKIAHLDRDAAMEAFAGFLNDQSLNEQQISFIKRVVDYVVENGYMEPRALNQPPFNRPRSFMQIFSTQQQMDLVGVIKSIKENAVTPAA